MAGIFYGIGVGPGDPELLTVKAINAIREVDVIIAPKTEKKDGSVALSIARPYLKEDVEIVYQVFPMVVRFEESTEAWEANKNEILSLLQAGKKVAFLTLGDPMFYSTYIYVYRLLEQEQVDIRTIPGIPAFCAVGSKLGYPIVEGNDVLSIIPATADAKKIKDVIAGSDNVVLMKVYKNCCRERQEGKLSVDNSGQKNLKNDFGGHKREVEVWTGLNFYIYCIRFYL